MLEEYKVHVDGVKEILKGNNISEVDGNKNKDVVTEEIACVMRIKSTDHVPKRAPRVLITGPPGSGRTTQAEKLAWRFNLIHVTTMIKNEIGKKSKIGK